MNSKVLGLGARSEMEIDQIHTPIKVLIVEDLEDKATLGVLELYRGGFYPFFELVGTQKEMEAALRSCRWDLVLSGDYLKAINATDALMILKSSGQNAPFVVIAESLGAEDAKALRRLGACVVWTREWDLLSPVVRREFVRTGRTHLLGDSTAFGPTIPEADEIKDG